MRRALFAAFLFSFILLAGCIAQEAPVQKPKQEKPLIVPEQQRVSISLIRVPEEIVDEGGKFTVVWYVDSEPVSKTEDTAVHYGWSPEQEPVTAAIYPLATQVQKGTVPGTFSAEMVAGEKDIYLRAHALVEGADYWTNESMVRVRAIPLNITIAITQAPSEINANAGFSVNWTVQSNKRKKPELMELRYGSGSGAEAGAAAYPNSVALENPEVPGSFGVYFEPFKTQAIWYFRVHVVVDNRDYWGDEFSIRMVQTLSYSSGF